MSNNKRMFPHLRLDSPIKSVSKYVGKSAPKKLVGHQIYTFRDLQESGYDFYALTDLTGINEKSASKLLYLLKLLEDRDLDEDGKL